MIARAGLEQDALRLIVEYRAPLVALVVTLGARALRGRLGPALAGGMGAAAGWAFLFGVAAIMAPRGAADRLVPLALGAGLAAASAQGAGPRLLAAVAPVLLALGGGWWLAGALVGQAALLRDGPVILAVAAAIGVMVRLLADGDSWRALAGALALWGALLAVHAPVRWELVAAVPVAVAVALLPRLPPGALMAGAAAAICLSAGRLAHGGFRAVDAACLMPLLAVWAAPRLRSLPPPAAALLAAGGCALLAWLVRFVIVRA